MKCPFRIGRRPYDGGEWCDPECALLVWTDYGCGRCAYAVIAMCEWREMRKGIDMLHTNYVKKEQE